MMYRIYKDRNNAGWWAESHFEMKRFLSWRHAIQSVITAIEFGLWELP